MQNTYDETADALYIKLQEGKFSKNQVLTDFMILDLDMNNQILGIEILDASQKIRKKILIAASSN